MAWRKHETHQAETKAVKSALIAAGFQDIKVGHGTGTAWAWLEIRAELPLVNHLQYTDDIGRLVCSGNCPCRGERDTALSRIYAIVRGVTGRSGEYNGNTLVELRERSA